jgi:hypothetical protein
MVHSHKWVNTEVGVRGVGRNRREVSTHWKVRRIAVVLLYMLFSLHVEMVSAGVTNA